MKLESLRSNLTDLWESVVKQSQGRDGDWTPAAIISLYSRLVAFVSFAHSLKATLERDLRKTDWTTAEAFLEETRKLVLKGLAYDERKKFMDLKMKKVGIHDLLKTTEELLEGARRIEAVLKGMVDVLNLDVKVSGAGHFSNK